MHKQLSAALFLFATPLVAQHETTLPSETGQSAFAAIAEIVQILSEDPNTIWDKANISALRDHLVDMELVTMQSQVSTAVQNQTVEFTISGEGATIQSIQRMTFAHAPMLQAETGWKVTVVKTQSGAKMNVFAAKPQDISRVKGLGFFGVMTIGAHHQAHHLQMARGSDPHH